MSFKPVTMLFSPITIAKITENRNLNKKTSITQHQSISEISLHGPNLIYDIQMT